MAFNGEDFILDNIEHANSSCPINLYTNFDGEIKTIFSEDLEDKE